MQNMKRPHIKSDAYRRVWAPFDPDMEEREGKEEADEEGGQEQTLDRQDEEE